MRYVKEGVVNQVERIQGKELFDNVFIDNFNNTKMKVKTHNVQTFQSKPNQQLSLLLY